MIPTVPSAPSLARRFLPRGARLRPGEGATLAVGAVSVATAPMAAVAFLVLCLDAPVHISDGSTATSADLYLGAGDRIAITTRTGQVSAVAATASAARVYVAPL